MFTGRVEESRALESLLFHTKHGNPHHFLIHGERGIGKSSLLVAHEWTAAGELTPWEGDRFRFLTVHVELEQSDTYAGLVRKIGAGLRRSVSQHNRAQELAKTVWDFVKRWEVMGVRYSPQDREPEASELLDELVFTFANTCSATAKEFDGILVLVDEADKPTADARLGEFAKMFTERLTKKSCDRVSLGLAGVTRVLDTLRQSHESSLRLFHIISLEPLLFHERIEVVQKSLAKAREKNGVDTRISDEAAEWIATYSEGYPHFIQQFGYSAFEADTDDLIDKDDVIRGAWGETGAFIQLGLKYFHDLYFDQIGSDDYRQVLRAMAEHLDNWVSKDEIRAAVQLKPTTLSNALQALRKRQIIIPKQGRLGVYRLPTKSFATWIKAYSEAYRPD